MRKSRVRGLPEFGGEYPVSVLSEEIEPQPRSGRQERLENYVNRFV